jgi:hypothetical protein
MYEFITILVCLAIVASLLGFFWLVIRFVRWAWTGKWSTKDKQK